MGENAYIPGSIEKDAILELLFTVNVPHPLTVEKIPTTGQYHVLYTLEYSPSDLEDIVTSTASHTLHAYHSTKLFLRISGTHLPTIKTENETANLAYVAQHAPKIPVPIVIRYDNSSNNPIGHEYQIMTICPGTNVDSVFHTWDEMTKKQFLDQVIGILKVLHALPMKHIGGFVLEPGTRHILPGPICEEVRWQMPDIDKYWKIHGLNESPETLNAQGTFYNSTDLNVAWLEKYIYIIERHPYMVQFRDMVPRLRRFVMVLNGESPPSWRLNDMRFVLAHRDLHFGNIMYDSNRRCISGIIDWEFSGSTVFCQWDPPRAFLASQPFDEEGIIRKRAWVQAFRKRCDSTGVDWKTLIFDPESGWSTKEQKLVHEAVNFVRCICEVAPTGERLDTVRSWRSIVEEKLQILGVV